MGAEYMSVREYNPHPPVSCGTGKEPPSGVPLVAHNKGCISPSVSFGKVLFRPNNYRRRIVAHDIPSDLVRGHPSLTPFISCGKGNGHIFVKGLYPRVTVQVGKKTITAIYDQHDENGKKEFFEVERVGGVERKAREINELLDGVLRDFSGRIGLLGVSVPVSTWHEDGLKGERFIDSLPKEMILQAGCVTKLYGEGVEFKGKEDAGVLAERYLRNTALLELAPELVRGIEDLKVVVGDPLGWVMEQCKDSWGSVLRPGVRVVVARLSDRERLVLSEWSFRRFGGVGGVV